MEVTQDYQWMKQAITQAQAALQAGQQPFGAVVVGPEGQLLGEGYNLVLGDHDPSAHGEVVAIRRAGVTSGTHKLDGCTVYTTCEPCLMCTTLILRSGVSRVVYGARATDLAGWQPLLGWRLADAAAWVNQSAGREVISVTPDVLREECLPFYTNWQAS